MTNNKAMKALIVLLVIAIALTIIQSLCNASATETTNYEENTVCTFEPTYESADEEVIETEISDELFEEIKDRSKLLNAVCKEESEETQLAIMATIFNREEETDFADTFYEVIQSIDVLKEAWNKEAINCDFETMPKTSSNAVMRMLQGEDPTEWELREEAIRLGLDPAEYADGGALYFHHLADCDQQMLESIKVKVTIGNYIFYRK